MKIIFSLLFILCSVGLAQDLTSKEIGNRSSLSIRLYNNTSQSIKTLPVSIRADIKEFSALKLTEKNDLELVKNVIKTLLIIDAPENQGGDPYRTTLTSLMDSYEKYASIYDKAMQQLVIEKKMSVIPVRL